MPAASGATLLDNRRANVIGIGMVGGSVAAALRARNWHVTGSDIDSGREQQAKGRGIIDDIGFDESATITFIATPVSSVVEQAKRALKSGGIVTDVASVKRPIVKALKSPKFIGGHPMAGSEKSGLDGVDKDLFQGVTWVLTPNESTNTDDYVRVREIVSAFGAAVVTLDPREHDQIVATISHVPHLAASALMTDALTSNQPRDTVLRLAAGGFRDMTRIAAGDPELWVDIISENRDAIVDQLGTLWQGLRQLQGIVEDDDREGLHQFLGQAAQARRDLPLRSGRPAELAFVRVPIPDRVGALGEVLSLFGELRVNVEDLEISHDPKGDRGYLQVTVAAGNVGAVKTAFAERNIPISVESQ